MSNWYNLLLFSYQKEDMVSVRVLLVFGADPSIENTHKMRAIEAVSRGGPLRDFLSTFSSVPGFNSVRKYVC